MGYTMEMAPHWRGDLVHGDLQAKTMCEALEEGYLEALRFALGHAQYDGDISYAIYHSSSGPTKPVVKMSYSAEALRQMPDPTTSRVEALRTHIQALQKRIADAASRDNFWKDKTIGDHQFALAQAQLPKCKVALASLEAQLEEATFNASVTA